MIRRKITSTALTVAVIAMAGAWIVFQFGAAITEQAPPPVTYTVECWRARPDTPPLCVKLAERDVR